MSYFLPPRAARVFRIVFVLLISSALFVVIYLHQQSLLVNVSLAEDALAMAKDALATGEDGSRGEMSVTHKWMFRTSLLRKALLREAVDNEARWRQKFDDLLQTCKRGGGIEKHAAATDFEYDIVITTYPRERRCEYLADTLLNVFASLAQPTRLIVVNSHADPIACERFQHLTSVAYHNVAKKDLELLAKSGAHNVILNYWVSLKQYAGRPLLVIEDDVLLTNNLYVRLLHGVDLSRKATQSRPCGGEFMLSLYNGQLLEQSPSEENGFRKAMLGLATQINNGDEADVARDWGWGWGTQALLFHGDELARNLTSWFGSVVSGDSQVSGLQDMVVREFFLKHPESTCVFGLQRSLAQHAGVQSTIFGDNKRFHVAPDFVEK